MGPAQDFIPEAVGRIKRFFFLIANGGSAAIFAGQRRDDGQIAQPMLPPAIQVNIHLKTNRLRLCQETGGGGAAKDVGSGANLIIAHAGQLPAGVQMRGRHIEKGVAGRFL